MIVKARLRVCRYCGDLHDVRAVPDNCKDPPPQRSEFPSPYVIGDSLPGGVNGLYHHAGLRKTDSKSEFRRITRAFGCVELGNDYEAATKPRAHIDMDSRSLKEAINEAMHQVAVDDGKGDDSVTVVT